MIGTCSSVALLLPLLDPCGCTPWVMHSWVISARVAQKRFPGLLFAPSPSRCAISCSSVGGSPLKARQTTRGTCTLCSAPRLTHQQLLTPRRVFTLLGCRRRILPRQNRRIIPHRPGETIHRSIDRTGSPSPVKQSPFPLLAAASYTRAEIAAAQSSTPARTMLGEGTVATTVRTTVLRPRECCVRPAKTKDGWSSVLRLGFQPFERTARAAHDRTLAASRGRQACLVD